MRHNWLESLSSARRGPILALESAKRTLEADVDDAIAADVGSALDRDSPENCDEEYWEAALPSSGASKIQRKRHNGHGCFGIECAGACDSCLPESPVLSCCSGRVIPLFIVEDPSLSRGQRTNKFLSILKVFWSFLL